MDGDDPSSCSNMRNVDNAGRVPRRAPHLFASPYCKPQLTRLVEEAPTGNMQAVQAPA
jgi:hypothetical protein